MKKQKSDSDKLHKELSLLRKRTGEIKEELRKIELDDVTKSNSIYVGKYFKSVHEGRISSYPEVHYVYSLEPDTASLKTIRVFDYSSGKGSHFGIEFESHFNPNKNELGTKYKEISKKEFDKVYNDIKYTIEKSLNENINKQLQSSSKNSKK